MTALVLSLGGQSEPVQATRVAASSGPATGQATRVAGLSGVVTVGQETRGVAAYGGPSGRATKIVAYLRYRFLVPRSWPVIRDLAHPRGCVRFDQHAVYLGAVNREEFCPSWLLGTTESVLIQPGPDVATTTSTENPVAREVNVRAPGIALTATFDGDLAVILRILASASLPAPVVTAASPAGRPGAADLATAAAAPARLRRGLHAAPRPAAPRPAARRAAARRAGGWRAGAWRSAAWRAGAPRPAMPVPALPAMVTSFHGLGFDACAAPSPRVMRAWRRHSPYRAIGIYIGGADRACAQPNLTSAWVRAQAQAGWRYIPLYAGPQAAFGELGAPVRQATAAAADAAAQARDLGFGPHTPIYYDMEGFRKRSRVAVLKFVSAWTSELHRLGYDSGVYSSSDSGIADLSRQYGRGIYAMPNIIYDALWNKLATTRDRHLPPGQWHHLRIHQFAGNVTQRYGGHTINLDEDYLDVRIRPPQGTVQQTPAVALPDGSVDLFALRGGRLWLDRYSPGAGWAKPARTGAVASSAPAVVWTGSAVEVFYKGAGGYLWADSYQPDGTLSARHELPALGILGSGPRAVASEGAIDVFWRGSLDDHLWHAQYLPGTGWAGPQGLGGDLASAPAPVTSSPGSTAVFWKGTDGSLWGTTRGLRGRWTKPLRLGMGPLGGAPGATAQPDGGIEVYWTGSLDQHLWEGFYRPGLGWRGPRDLGGQVRSAPWPVTAAGTVRVMWRGGAHRLTVISHRPGDGWNAVGWGAPVAIRVGWLGSAPFAAVGDPGSAVWAFWRGRHGGLWAVSSSRNGWGTPRMLAG